MSVPIQKMSYLMDAKAKTAGQIAGIEWTDGEPAAGNEHQNQKHQERPPLLPKGKETPPLIALV
jgi:hypothetical protein